MTEQAGTDVVGRMAAAAEAFLDTLDPGQRSAATTRLDDPGFRSWTYLPGPREGVALADMDQAQQQAALALLDTGCSATGARTARSVVELDLVRRVLAGATPQPHDHRFWFRLFGTPSPGGAWAWRVNGHHLGVHVTVAGRQVAVTPSFFGAEPARVPGGPRAGLRVLAREEDDARALLHSLDATQRAVAVTSATAPDDILTRFDPVADASAVPRGIPHGDLRPEQQTALQRLVQHYFGRVTETAAREAWDAAVAAGLDEVHFGWAGGTEPGQGHYYAVVGPTFLLEYDNTQDGANHIHSVWRDLRDDWGGDLLARHYAAAHG
jgi:Protein of unknown function (DUF3500)